MISDQHDDFPKRVEILVSRVGNVAELARRSHLSRRVIDNYKGGVADPSRTRLIALADAADVSVEWLATGDGPMTKDSGSDAIPITDIEISIQEWEEWENSRKGHKLSPIRKAENVILLAQLIQKFPATEKRAEAKDIIKIVSGRL
ncbi:helix-turn-helix domain-containing protein [Rhodospirillum sp. A1_3_36]|uniref:helix-turn-helix domain-containing protein n=1 Tax=Rhodospirillum sp. A1_3_36 TaxID=3391666 RepID=UPI0039A60AF2